MPKPFSRKLGCSAEQAFSQGNAHKAQIELDKNGSDVTWLSFFAEMGQRLVTGTDPLTGKVRSRSICAPYRSVDKLVNLAQFGSRITQGKRPENE